jgi:Flp pilus assembly pilin Flp
VKATPIWRRAKEKGATVLEYALIGTLVAVVCVSAVTYLGREVSEGFSQIGSGFTTS